MLLLDCLLPSRNFFWLYYILQKEEDSNKEQFYTCGPKGYHNKDDHYSVILTFLQGSRSSTTNERSFPFWLVSKQNHFLYRVFEIFKFDLLFFLCVCVFECMIAEIHNSYVFNTFNEYQKEVFPIENTIVVVCITRSIVYVLYTYISM